MVYKGFDKYYGIHKCVITDNTDVSIKGIGKEMTVRLNNVKKWVAEDKGFLKQAVETGKKVLHGVKKNIEQDNKEGGITTWMKRKEEEQQGADDKKERGYVLPFDTVQYKIVAGTGILVLKHEWSEEDQEQKKDNNEKDNKEQNKEQKKEEVKEWIEIMMDVDMEEPRRVKIKKEEMEKIIQDMDLNLWEKWKEENLKHEKEEDDLEIKKQDTLLEAILKLVKLRSNRKQTTKTERRRT